MCGSSRGVCALKSLVAVILTANLLVLAGTSISPAQQGTPEAKILAIGPQSEIHFAAPWTPSAMKYSNAQELVVLPSSGPGRGAGKSTAYAVARILITTESRSSYADALDRLRAIAASRSEPAQFVEIGGWPAVEVKFTEPLPRRGAGGAAEEAGAEAAEVLSPEILVQRVVTAIAADDKVVKFDASVLPDAPQGLLQGAQDLARSAHFAEQGNPSEVQDTLRGLQGEESKRQLLLKQRGGAAPERAPPIKAAAAPRVGSAVAVQQGLGELEIAASPDANDVIIAANSGLSFSTNHGASFTPGGTGVFGLNDPSLALAQSGNFYLGVIAVPTGTPPQLNVTGCTNAVSRSTNSGASFGLKGYSAKCPLTGTVCFPDQPHIAADALNGAGENDQIYAVWRNITPAKPVSNCTGIGGGFITPSIACSQDNGVTWTARATIPSAGDYPRVAIGRDGAVYVVSQPTGSNEVLLNRFTSCTNGLVAEAGFPKTVATLSGVVACPVPGLDRCNDGNTLSSSTAAPDLTEADHLFVSFAESDGAGGERIVAVESHDRGLSFPNRTTVSANLSARRFMPWSCSLGGSAWVGWYDRSASKKPNAASNDLTDYFIGSTSGTNLNLSNNPDPQCASGWPCRVRSPNDSESCSVQPELAGFCQRQGGGGSGIRCDFSGPDATKCPTGETCKGGGGCPKYGDYNGIACAGNFVIAAWASATAPQGAPPISGIGVFSSILDTRPVTGPCLTLGAICSGPNAPFQLDTCCGRNACLTSQGVSPPNPITPASCALPRPPGSCNGRPRPPGGCLAGWRCCGEDGWECGVCQ